MRLLSVTIHILFDKEPERFDLMYNFVPVDNIHFSVESLKNKLL